MEVFKRTLLNEVCEKIKRSEDIGLIISEPVREGYRKLTLSPINSGYQLAKFTETQVFHENLNRDETIIRLRELMESYRQLQEVIVTASAHNRAKQHIFREGVPVPFLVSLGIMTPDGKVKAHYQKKFKQINRFVEFIGDVQSYLPDGGTVLDFGCGKSYLTFAAYHYLNAILNKNITICGLDLKEDVVLECNKLSREFGFNQLSFAHGRIEDYSGKPADMVISLHACDTATDYAIAKAIEWKSKVILSVPCCQHELNQQIKNPELDILLSHGILKERFTSLLTDAVRAEVLKSCGYKTTVMEFIDMEHTPKNILIRAVKTKNANSETAELERLMSVYDISQTLFNLVKRK